MDTRAPINSQTSYATAERWAEIKPIFEELYLKDDQTLIEVIKILKDSYDFHATERQFKTRIKEWELNRKRIKNEVYRAMFSYLTRFGEQTIFTVLVGCKHEEKTAADINKEINRQKHQGKFQDMECSIAEEILDRAGVIVSQAPILPGVMNESDTPDMLYDIESAASSPMLHTPGSVVEGPPEPSAKQDWEYDMTTELARLSLCSAHNPISEHRIASFFGPQNTGNVASECNTEILCASRCVAPCIVACICHHSHPMQTAFSEQARCDDFRYLILKHSQYVLLSLNWLMTAFGWVADCMPLIEYLDRSCAIINQAWPTENNMVILYGHVFTWALKHYTGDQVGRDITGAHLELAVVRAREIWGLDSPNALITEYYLSFHLLERRDFKRAEEGLSSCATRAERTLGPSDNITINCLSLLARCYHDQGDTRRSIFVLEKALRRFRNPLGPFAHFYFELTSRLARLYTETRDVDRVEDLLKTTVNGRVCHTGLDDGTTWAAIERYCDLMAARGRSKEAFHFYQSKVNQHIDDQTVAWYRRNEYEEDAQMHRWNKITQLSHLQRHAPPRGAWFRYASRNPQCLARTYHRTLSNIGLDFGNLFYDTYTPRSPD